MFLFYSAVPGVYIDEVASEDALDCNGWSRLVRIALLASAGGLLVLLSGALLAACCVKYRNKMTVIPCGSAKLSPKGGSVSGKHIDNSEWPPTSVTSEKANYVLSQTRLPAVDQHADATEQQSEGNGVYICQLSTGHMRQAATGGASLRNLQTLQSPDLLELCRTPDVGIRGGFSSMARQPTRVILNSGGGSAATLRQTKTADGRPAVRQSPQAQEDHVQIPFCYYFE